MPKAAACAQNLAPAEVFRKNLAHDLHGALVAGHGEENRSHRLVRGAAIRPGYAGNRQREMGAGIFQRAHRHGLHGGLGDRAEPRDQLLGDAEHVRLGLVAVGDEAALEHVGGAGNFGESGGDHAAGATLGQRQFQLLFPRNRQKLFRLLQNMPVHACLPFWPVARFASSIVSSENGVHVSTTFREDAPSPPPARRCLPDVR